MFCSIYQCTIFLIFIWETAIFAKQHWRRVPHYQMHTKTPTVNYNNRRIQV